jgi:hypothetical protein
MKAKEAAMKSVIPISLSDMRGVLAEASRRLSVVEGSLEHEELASRIIALFESNHDADEVLAAALSPAK